MKQRYLSIAFLLLLVGTVATAQRITLQTNQMTKSPLPSVLPADQKEAMLRNLDSFINEYALKATLLDPKKKQVNGESVKAFQNLFTPTAELPKDYLIATPVGDYVNARDYAATVYNLMTTQGIQVKYLTASVMDIEDDPNGFFVPRIKITKQMFNGVDGNGKVKVNTSGRLVEQIIKLDIPKDNLTRIRISSVKPAKETKPAEDYTKYAGLTLGINNGFGSAKTSDYWNIVHPNANLDARGALSFSFGYDLLTNSFARRSAAQKPLFLSAALQLSVNRFKTSLSEGFEIAPFSATTLEAYNDLTGSYQRTVSSVDVTEKTTVVAVELPIGLAYRLMNGRKSSFLVNFRFVPGCALFNTSTLKGTATYDAALSQYNWHILGSNAYNPDDDDFEIFEAGVDQTIDRKPEKLKGGFTFGIQVAPTYYIDLSDTDPTWSLGIGLDLLWRPITPISFDPGTGDILRYSNPREGIEPNVGLMQNYVSSMKVFNAGLRIALHRKIGTKA